MIAFLIIALLFMTLMPCALFFPSIDDFFEKAKIHIQNQKIKREEIKIKRSEAEVNTLKKEKESLYFELNELKLKKEKEFKQVLDSKNRIIENIKEESINELNKKDEHIKELEAKIQLLELPVEKTKEKEQRETNTDNTRNTEYKKKSKEKDFRKKYPADIRCQDGDYVRSKSERNIDDFFYQNKIWHIYEPTYINPQTKQKYYPDFFLPDYNLYLEYYGRTNTEYIEKKGKKIKMYQSDPTIHFEYLTQDDDNDIYEKLKELCIKYSIPTK